MSAKIKNHFKKVIDDKELVQLISCHLLIATLHLLYFVRTHNSTELLRAAICTAAALSGTVFYRPGLRAGLIIYALTLPFYTQAVNYTDFFLIIISCRNWKRPHRIAIVTLYAIDILLAFSARHEDPLVFGIYAVGCFIIYTIIKIINDKDNTQEPVPHFTEDEVIILEQLAQGKLQKEIEGFTKNTITKKLQQAQDRNHYTSREELKINYIKYRNNQDHKQTESHTNETQSHY